MSQNTGFEPWDALIEATAEFQKLVPDSVLVGGTAAALHVGHRISTDADLTIGDLRERFPEIFEKLEKEPGWELERRNVPVMIMGNFNGVETTLRQLIRTKPLETEILEFGGRSLRVPTIHEMIRIKGWLALTRNAFRDYLDFAALTAKVGPEETRDALLSFDDCYKDVSNKKIERDVSPLIQFARQIADPLPGDLKDVSEVARYKNIVEEWNTWDKVRTQCLVASMIALEVVLERGLILEDDLGNNSESAQYPIPPEHPEGTHKAFLLSDRKTYVVRELDEATGEFSRMGNPSGPAVTSGEKVVYALHGERMSYEDWKNEPDVQSASDLKPKR
jgi:hypothetical protein